ncbi:hypothetical protein GPS50_04335 [Acinetobacter haemolyticus]|uniref:hypothetical protein n=1 Tax=Acinetobacter haemolyticus TaxID=29430 RepID=UPI0013735FB7|nr:hypothetical protein [Acinetobacter haemolyticus]NAR56695.1 hypothetical protein [Acinetobacter haemolyticus]NAR78974.1 hypothetical protein [Acinetobacter haemolyticus]
MKKILIAGMAALGLVLSGCTESKTGLQKNVINTGFEKCTDYLTSSLKSPSSLRISEAAVFVQKPEAQDVYSVFGDIVVKDGKITEIARDNKRRFREMLVAINYEAQNSYGVYLGGTYQCQYLFELNNDEISPEPLNTYLIKLKSDGEDVGLGVHIPIADFTGSNWVLDKQIKKLISTTDSKFAAADEEMYKELIKQKEYADQELEAEKIRKSWESLSAEEAAEQAAAVAIDAAEAALRE